MQPNSGWLWLNLSGKHNLTLNQSIILYTHSACTEFQKPQYFFTENSMGAIPWQILLWVFRAPEDMQIKICSMFVF
jgi:hypothetical protein